MSATLEIAERFRAKLMGIHKAASGLFGPVRVYLVPLVEVRLRTTA